MKKVRLVPEEPFRSGPAEGVPLHRRVRGTGDCGRESVAEGVATGERGVCSLPGRDSQGPDLKACFVDIQAARPDMQ